MNITERVLAELSQHVTLTQAEAQRFFKTTVGSYGDHDKFLGITVPNVRKIAKQYYVLSLDQLAELLQSPFNEVRFFALVILVHQYQKADLEGKEKRFQFYLKNMQQINNWNLVDVSAHHIVGSHLWRQDGALLYKLVLSSVLWERRIAIVATWYYIRQGQVETTFCLAEKLFLDRHDLIHKAVGWMLREVGKRDQEALITFLRKHAAKMPKTMLRYAMERLSQEQKAGLHNTHEKIRS